MPLCYYFIIFSSFSLLFFLFFSPSAEFYTTQLVLEQVFSQSASVQRRPWKSKYFLNLIVRLKKKKAGRRTAKMSSGFQQALRVRGDF